MTSSVVLPIVIALLAARAGDEIPPTATVEVVETLHGTEVADPFRWLEDGSDAGVQTWMEQQNAATRARLQADPAARESLRKRLDVLYGATTLTSPRVVRDRYFFFRQSVGQNQPVLYQKRRNLSADASEVLNPNTMSADATTAVDWWYPSPDGKLIAYGRSTSGDELSTLHLRNVDSAADTALKIPRTRSCSVAWDRDGGGFHYVQYPAAGSVPEEQLLTTRLVRYHRFGTAVQDDPIVFGKDAPPNEWHDVMNASDHAFQFLTASLDWSRNDLYIRRNEPGAVFEPVAVGLAAQFEADVLDDTLLLLTTLDAPRKRIMATSVDKPGQEHWRELVPQQKGVIESLTIIDGKLVLRVLENAYSRLLVFGPDGTQVTEVPLPTLGTVTDVTGRPDRPELIFRFESFVFPPTLFRYDLGTHELTSVEQTSIDADLDAYETRQVWFESRDGTRVPMFLIHRRGLEQDGRNPTVLYGYGGFGVSVVPRFRRDLLPWLDQGGVFASANLRGGGEFGEEWHQAGRLGQKQNVFDDMIAAAEHLVREQVTSPERLGIMGGSNGGLLVGAVMVQRPDLCRAVYCAVPLLDMLRYHKFLIGSLWIPEYGSADDPDQFAWLLAYSPYHNVKAETAYPAALFTAAESDSRVDPLHARKMAARVQAANNGPHPILLWIERQAGHGKGKPLDKLVETKVDQWIFFQQQLVGPPGAVE